jgi:hypothetical protein
MKTLTLATAFTKKIVTRDLKGHGNEPNFPRFLHKSVRHGSLTLPFEPFRLLLRIRGDIRNRRTTPPAIVFRSSILINLDNYSTVNMQMSTIPK